MNRYVITFPFQGEYQFAYFTANQLANAVLPCTDDILSFKCENEEEDFTYPITINGNKKYEVTFTPDKPQCVNIYNAYDEDGEEYDPSCLWDEIYEMDDDQKAFLMFRDSDFCQFLWQNGIGDLHEGNFGYYKGCAVIVDFAGFQG